MSSLIVINRQISKTEETLYRVEQQLSAKRDELEDLALGLTHLYDYMEEYKQIQSPQYIPKKHSNICKKKQEEIFQSLNIAELPATDSPIYNDQLVKTIRELKARIREEKQTLVRLKKVIVTHENELHYLRFERKRKLS
ncbi:hypothetical protein [Oceanobacillus manasiensis]|uniref:hypothetical protein n=1 Tax=Oceanobacillus manasiensis TaxID=586413 RepID=UPI0005A8706F|nr:hypothetical protein [Oceanobacillus manasiensis]